MYTTHQEVTMEVKVLMIILTIVLGNGSGTTQTVTETTATTCAIAQKRLDGGKEIPVSGMSRSTTYRQVDCIPIIK